MRPKNNYLERQVRRTLGLKAQPNYPSPPELDDRLSDPTLRADLESFEDAFEF